MAQRFRERIVTCNNCKAEYDAAEFDFCPECLMDQDGNDCQHLAGNEGHDYDDFLRSEQIRKNK